MDRTYSQTSKRDRIGPDHPLFKGGKSRDSNGYVTLSSKIWGEDTGRREHQVVMEKMLGRKLRHGEVVHHINGDKADNRPENLSLETRASHNREHGKGEVLSCSSCGSQRWYGPALASTLVQPYLCRPCFLSRRNPMKGSLSEDQILEIRRRRSAGERGRDLSAEFGVSEQTISNIYRGRSYR